MCQAFVSVIVYVSAGHMHGTSVWLHRCQSLMHTGRCIFARRVFDHALPSSGMQQPSLQVMRCGEGFAVEPCPKASFNIQVRVPDA